MGLLTVAVLIGGCTGPPDASPWVDATSQLRVATAAAARITVQEIDLTADAFKQARIDPEKIDDLLSKRRQLTAAWKKREDVMTATVIYAESVQAIIDAGNEGAESADKVIGSFRGLAEATGYSIPASKETIAIASDSIKLIAKHIARDQATKRLKETLREMQPAVLELSKLIQADLKDIQAGFDAINTARSNAWRVHPDFEDLGPHRKTLQAKIRNLDLDKADDVALGEQLAAMLDRADANFARRQAGLDKINESRRLGMALLTQMNSAITAWADAHGQLASAVEQGKPVSVCSLTEAAVQIRSLIQRIQEQ